MSRLEVLKTYKLYIGGKFPRTESGRYYTPENKKGEKIANLCLSSRKDVKNAVVAARKVFADWSSRSAFNRSQILYRIAEMMEGRKAQLVEELVKADYTKKNAEQEVEKAIDRMVYYAGWCDKYTQVFSTVNPVASPHFNFSVPEPMGVITIAAPEKSALLGLVSSIAPAICGGNTCVVLAAEKYGHSAITFAEIINDSDVPGGVVNLLTGKRGELLSHLSSHKDVNGMIYFGDDQKEQLLIKDEAVSNLKRVFCYGEKAVADHQNPYPILDLQEIKTTWHPIEKISAAGSGY